MYMCTIHCEYECMHLKRDHYLMSSKMKIPTSPANVMYMYIYMHHVHVCNTYMYICNCVCFYIIKSIAL